MVGRGSRARRFVLDTLGAAVVALLGGIALAQAQTPKPPVGGERTKRIVFGGDRDFPPLESLDKEGNPRGFQVDLIREVARVNEWDVSVVLGPWSDVLAKFKSGEIDVIGMSDLAERRDYALFADPHSVYASEIFHRAGTTEVALLEELAGREVIVQSSGLAQSA